MDDPGIGFKPTGGATVCLLVPVEQPADSHYTYYKALHPMDNA
ncbi:MAG TPA: hypothetical protein VGE66_09775 [Chitinophagaceae bacterium]